MAPAAARRRGDGEAAVLRQGFTKHYEEGGGVGEGEGGNQRQRRTEAEIPTRYRRQGGGEQKHHSISPAAATLTVPSSHQNRIHELHGCCGATSQAHAPPPAVCLVPQDISTRVIAEGLRVEQTAMSKIMTRNPTYVTADSLAIEALQKMVQAAAFRANGLRPQGDAGAEVAVNCHRPAAAGKKIDRKDTSGSAVSAGTSPTARLRWQLHVDPRRGGFAAPISDASEAPRQAAALAVLAASTGRSAVEDMGEDEVDGIGGIDPTVWKGAALRPRRRVNGWVNSPLTQIFRSIKDMMFDFISRKFRHLPVVENGEVMAMLDIAKCLYDAIARLEKAAEQGSAIAAAVEGVERQLGGNFTAPYAFIETLRERMFKPSLSTIVTEDTKVAIVSPSDPVYVATQKMREFRVNSVIVTTGNTVQGIFTSKDVLMRVVSQNLSPELTLVEKVMTANPDCAMLDTTILDALHIMHDGKFLHIPVLDREGQIAACLDVLQLTHAAIQLVEGGNGTANDMANSVMQRFWDSALALEPPDDELDSRSEASLLMASEAGDGRSSIYPPIIGNSFPFKLQDRKGRVHRFTCGSESLNELVSSVRQRLSIIDEKDIIQILYEDDEGDRVLLTTDTDLAGAVLHAKSSGLKVLKLHIVDEFNPNTEVVYSYHMLTYLSPNE
ncbi:Meiotically up-regulated gene 70 protein [Triticum urartu]|uniref:Meiotically up-regulated gene 70 protein n=1 Tax=Triticum urartu TaxID=4572 RepID=M7ZRK7_TRIUA|nr:Meiotically up-regulated gene 70 protein [Triticum urartu]